MKDNDVAYFSEQLGLTKEVVEASVEDGTFSQRVKDLTKDQVIYKSQTDFDTFKTNHASEVTNNYFTDLVDKAKKGDIPQELYAPIKGANLQQFERELSKRLGVETYNDVNDLIDQAIKTSANGNGDKELQRQVEELRTANTTLQEEKDKAVTSVEEKYMNISLDKDKSDILRGVPFDFSNVKADELESKRQKTQTLLKSVFDTEYTLGYEDSKLVVFKDGKVHKDPATFVPVDPKDVFISLAKDYGMKLTSPDSGGQGGSSSASSNTMFADIDAFYAHCKANEINPHSPEGIALAVKSGVTKLK